MKAVLLSVFMLVFIVSLNAQEKPKSCENKANCDKKAECVKKADCEKKAGCENKMSCENKSKAETTGDKTNSARKAVVVNKVCPVSGEELGNTNVTFIYNGKTYGLCCKKCLSVIKADPAKYIAKLDNNGMMKK